MKKVKVIFPDGSTADLDESQVEGAISAGAKRFTDNSPEAKQKSTSMVFPDGSIADVPTDAIGGAMKAGAIKKKDGSNGAIVDANTTSTKSVPTTSQSPVSTETTTAFDIVPKTPTVTTNDGFQFPVTNLVTNNLVQTKNTPEAILALQNRITSKTATNEDIQALAQSSGKSIDAVNGYIHGGRLLGGSVENLEQVNQKKTQLTNYIKDYNTIYGTQYDPTEVLSSSEKANDFLAVARNTKAVNTPQQAIGQQVAASTRVAGINQPISALLPLSVSNEMVNQIVSKTVDEDMANGVSKDATVIKIAKTLNPKEFAKVSDVQTPVPVLGGTNPAAVLGNLLRNNTKEDELLNFQKGNAELYYNQVLKQNAINKISEGVIGKDEKMVTDGQTILSQVDENVADKYPALQKQEIVRRVNETLAQESGVLQGSDATPFGTNLSEVIQGASKAGISLVGASNEDRARVMKELGYFDNPKTRDAAYSLLGNPSSFADNSVAGSVGTNFLQPFKDLGMSVADISGIRNAKDIYSDKISDQLFKKDFSQNTGDEPQLRQSVKLPRTILNTTANLAGMVAISTATEGIVSGLGGSAALGQKLGAYTSFGLPSFDASLKDSKNFLDSEPAQYIYAGINAIANAEGGRLLDLGKVTRIPGVSEEFAKVAQGLSDNSIAESAARELLDGAKNKYVDFAVKYGKNVTKGAATMAYFTTANNIIKYGFGDPNIKGEDILPQAGHAFLDGVLGMSIMGGFGAVADMRNEKNTSFKGTIYNMAVNHDAAKDVFDIGLKNGEYDKAAYDNKIAILSTAVSAKYFLDVQQTEANVNLSQDQRAVYVANKTAENVLRSKAKDATLPEDKAKYERQAEQLKIQSNQILEGLKFNATTLEPLQNQFEAGKKYDAALQNFNPDNPETVTALEAAKNKLDEAIQVPEAPKVQGQPENISKPIDLSIEPLTNTEQKQWNDLSMEEKLKLAKENLPNVEKLSDTELAKVADTRAKELLTKLNPDISTQTVEQPIIENQTPNDTATGTVNEPIPTDTKQPEGQGTQAAVLPSTNAINEPTTATTDAVLDPLTRAKELVNSGVVKGFTSETLKDAANNNETEFKDHLKSIAEQSQDPRSEKATIETYGKELVNAANELFPKKESNISNNLPPENDNISPVGEVKDGTGITHAQTNEIANELGFGEYEAKPETVAEWDAEAEKRIKDDPQTIPKLLDKMSKGGQPDKIEQRVIAKYVATLKAQIEKNPTNEKIAEMRNVIDLSNIAGGREVGKSLVARKGIHDINDSLAGYFMTEMDTNLDAPLTDAQKETVKKEYNDISQKEKQYQDSIAKLEAENARLKAEKNLKKEKPVTDKTAKKTHEDFVKDRDAIIKAAQDKIQAARDKKNDPNAPKLQGVGGRTKIDDLFTIAPEVLKLVKSYVEEGVTNLGEIIRNIHPVLKQDIPDITEKDVHDIIAGDYNKKQRTKSEAQKNLFEVKQQAQLINKLERLIAGTEPKNEKAKIKRNQEIESLQKQIKDFKKAEADAAKIPIEKIPIEKIQKDPRQVALESLRSRNEKALKEIEAELKADKFSAVVKKTPFFYDTQLQKDFPELYKQAVGTQNALIKAKQQRQIRLAVQQYENRSKYEKLKDEAVRYLNVPRTLMASMDYSAPLRQAVIVTVAHPLTALKAANEMFKASFSQSRFDRWSYDLKETPRYRLMEDSGLSLTDPHSLHLQAQEEAFMGNIAEKIPVIGGLVKGSERAYVSYLNKMRADLFNRYADSYEAQGRTFENSPKLYKGLASYVNNATGRGNLGFAETAAPILNSFLFSPRLIASRFNMLGLGDIATLGNGFYGKLPKEVRVLAMKDMATFIGAGIGLLALAKFGLGLQVESDPRSSDFGKIKSGDTRWDIWGGFQPYVRVLSQVIAGERKSTNTGKMIKISGEHTKFGASRVDPLVSFARGKLAPIPSMTWDLLSGHTILGNKILMQWGGKTKAKEITLKDEAIQHFLPLIYSDVQQAVKDKGISSLFTVGIPSIFGVGVQTYSNPKKK